MANPVASQTYSQIASALASHVQGQPVVGAQGSFLTEGPASVVTRVLLATVAFLEDGGDLSVATKTLQDLLAFLGGLPPKPPV